uniref:hypothetical protein n=1 Tax=Peptacetobacter sp. TaxID=2991975 RepID=UPI002604799B
EDQKQFGEDLNIDEIENVQLAFSTDKNFGQMDCYFDNDKVYDFEDMDEFIEAVIRAKEDITKIDYLVTVNGEEIAAFCEDVPFLVDDIKIISNELDVVVGKTVAEVEKEGNLHLLKNPEIWDSKEAVENYNHYIALIEAGYHPSEPEMNITVDFDRGLSVIAKLSFCEDGSEEIEYLDDKKIYISNEDEFCEI